MSLGMTLSFTPEVQITKNYCKNTMKLHWGYIGTYTANKWTKRQMNQSVLSKIESRADKGRAMKRARPSKKV